MSAYDALCGRMTSPLRGIDDEMADVMRAQRASSTGGRV
jgi:hypothetical protein